MAHRVIQQDLERLSCSICLDLLKDPVTIPCGHNYCMSCMKDCWDEEAGKKKEHSCPQCRQIFTPRPVLVKNTLLAELVEELKKVPPKCSRHDEAMKMFCRTDQHCICYLCSMAEHKSHDIVSAAAEMAYRQAELWVTRRKIQQRVQDRERAVKVLQQRVESSNRSADEAVRDSGKVCDEMIRLIERRSSEVKHRIESQQRTQVSEAEELEKKLQQEITELRRKEAELEQLSRTEDHLSFLNNYHSLSRLNEFKDSMDTCPLLSFEDVVASVSETRDILQAVLSEDRREISLLETEVDAVLPQAEPRTRADFLKYSCQITLDPNTAHKRLSLIDGNRKATLMACERLNWGHPYRCVERFQVLSRDGLTGRHYWEVDWEGSVDIAVAYKKISRTGATCESGFGCNDKSWALECFTGRFIFRHNNTSTSISGPRSCRIGVYLDHRAGTLSYYSVSGTVTLLHRVQTTFTQPLYAGFRLPCYPAEAELCELK